MKKDDILAILKGLYQHMPGGEWLRGGIKDAFYHTFSFALKNTDFYRRWRASKYGEKNTFLPSHRLRRSYAYVGEQRRQPGKIAIQLHLFYVDLAEEFASYLKNMPFAFDLLLSIVDEGQKAHVEEVFTAKNIPHLNRLIVRVVPNRGRDVAPFLIGFGDLLDDYDFIAHIHSKKSLYTGSEQVEWRNYLLDCLLGDAAKIRRIFALFVKRPNLGLLYPQPADNVPYAAFTWLSNRAVGAKLLGILDVPNSPTAYFDFSAGTMFWARTKAIRRLYTSGLKLEDFAEEQHQNDGTIAHAVERVLALTVTAEGMDYGEMNTEVNAYTLNWGNKNLMQYFGKNPKDFPWIANHDCISFDIFDTLVMRRIAFPALVNKWLEVKAGKLLGRSFAFRKYRLLAEQELRESRKPDEQSDVTLTEIYEKLREIANLSPEEAAALKEMEVAAEVQLCCPRPEAVDCLKFCRKEGRKIYLNSDMYLETPDVLRILEACGITADLYDGIFLSSETGRRKDTAATWNFLAEKKGMAGKMVHIGDNEWSDIQLCSDRGIASYHMMSAVNLFSLTPFGHEILTHYGKDMSLYAGILLGTILEKFFHNPYVLHARRGQFRLDTFEALGYFLYGPILFTYILWLIRRAKKDGCRRLLFFARDGYFLGPLYRETAARLLKATGEEPLPSAYFLTSRRSVTLASFQTFDDILDSLQTKYEGTLGDFLRARLGMALPKDVEDREITLPEDSKNKAFLCLLREMAGNILAQAEEERASYMAYIKAEHPALLTGEKIGIIDIGYAGTTQYFLSKMLHVAAAEGAAQAEPSFVGYYFGTNQENWFKDEKGEAEKKIYGCFAEDVDATMLACSSRYIYRYQLLLEAVLTSPDGQLNCFHLAEGKPVPSYEPQHADIAALQKLHAGAENFAREVLDTYGEDILDIEEDTSFLESWLAVFVLDDTIIAEELEKLYTIDDTFCNTSEGNSLEFYRTFLEKEE